MQNRIAFQLILRTELFISLEVLSIKIVGIQYDEQPQVPNGQMLASCPIRILGT
jgi:hypothetical protein